MRTSLSLALAGLLLVSCAESLTEDPGGGGGQAAQGQWTVLVYMLADNNLEPFALQDLEEMTAVGSTDQVRIVAEVDRTPDFASDPVGGIADWTSTKRFLVHQGSLEELSDLGETNMGDPGALSDFIRWGAAHYPAKHTALVLWDHGGGWDGFGSDDTSGADGLSLVELEDAVRSGLAGGKLDLIGFDACLMASFEVAATLAPHADYLLASEETEPGHGWDYHELASITQNPSAGAADLGGALLRGFEAQALEQKTFESVTLSLTDLGALAPLVTAVNAAAADVQSASGSSALAIGRQLEGTLAFGEMGDPTQSRHFVDLGDFFTRLAGADPTWASHRDAVLSALQGAVVARTAGRAKADASGLSIFFPATQELYRTAYDGIAAASSWRAALKAYYGGAAGAVVPTFTNADGKAEWQIEGGSLNLQGDLDPAGASSVAAATLYTGTSDESDAIFLTGDQPGGFDAARAFGSWTLGYLTLHDASQQGLVYASWDFPGEGLASLTIPFVYAPPGADTQWASIYAVYDSGGNVLSATYYVTTDAGVAELTPEEGSLIYPVVVSYGTTVEWVYSSTAGFDPFDPDLGIDWNTFAAGDTVYATVAVENIAGQGDSVYFWSAL